MTIGPLKTQRHDHIKELLEQNRRILKMNERLLGAILNPPVVIEAQKPDIDELMKRYKDQMAHD